jgi:hypothetical protein
MVVQLINVVKTEGPKIQVKFLDGPKTDEILYLKSLTSSMFNENTPEIKIGRMTTCQIKFTDNSLSRV